MLPQNTMLPQNISIAKREILPRIDSKIYLLIKPCNVPINASFNKAEIQLSIMRSYCLRCITIKKAALGTANMETVQVVSHTDFARTSECVFFQFWDCLNSFLQS